VSVDMNSFYSSIDRVPMKEMCENQQVNTKN